MQNIERLPRNVHGSLRSGVVMFDLPRVVEELVNNSLDANPAKVSVFVNVRTCYIKIEDDGCGITRDELVILGEKYATSKSGLVDDGRSSTHGLGFRGEALLSLSNISIVEVRTKARGKPNAYCKIIKGSKCLFLGIDDQREGVGTTVIVRDLFYNQPVRRRYMQSSSKKVLYCVKKVVLRAAFVHSQVSFKLVDIDSEEELICTTPSSSPLPFVSNMFSKEVSDSLHEIVFSDDMLMLSGYISGPGDVCPTKALQYLYVNLRFISKGPIHNLLNNLASSVLCSLALHAVDPEIQGGKRHKIQANPAFILNLHCPTSLYDLHFEPSKTIIEFKDWDTVLTFFERAVRQSWQQHLAPSLQGSSQKIGALRKSEAQKEEAVCLLDNMLQPNPNASQPCSQPVPSEDFQPYMIEPSNEKPSTFDKRHYGQADAIDDVPEYSASGLAKWRLGIPQTKDEDILHKPVEQTNDILDISSGLLHISGDSLVPELINKDCLHNARVLYQLDKKFIPVMANGRLMIIDQHAADERIRVEELRRQVVSGEGRRVTYLESEQELVLPEMGFQLLQKYSEKIQNWGWIFNIHSASQNLFNKNLNLLRRHSSRVILVAVPCILGINLNDKDLLEFIQQLVETDGSSTLPPSVLRILNFKACRGAIMFGDSLLPSECSLIVEELKATSLCFQCAHGRPTTVPLLNMASLHEQLAKLKVDQEGSSETWHGLRVHRRPSIRRAQLLLDSAKRFHNG